MKKLISLLLTLSMLGGLTPAFGYGAARGYNTITAGVNYTFAIKSDASLWAWGAGGYGQLGTKKTDYLYTPTKVMENVASVAAGLNHTAAIKTDKSLWMWGRNHYGQLGDGTVVDRLEPVRVMNDVAAIAVGENHTLAVKTDGSLWGFGYNGDGQLGIGQTFTAYTPIRIMTGVRSVSAGATHSLAVKTDGSLWAWGLNEYGQLGDKSNLDRPLPVQVMSNVNIAAAGKTHSIALKTDGTVWTWGNNWAGQLGNNTQSTMEFESSGSLILDNNVNAPLRVVDKVSAIAAGEDHNVIVKTDGSIWAWGNNRSGQIGKEKEPLYVKAPVRVTDGGSYIAAGGTHTIAIKSDGRLWAWGGNLDGQLGIGKFSDQSLPVRSDIGELKTSGYVSYVTVSFQANGGTSTSSVTIRRGQTLSAPESPTRSGYRFEGWYKEYDFRTPFQFGIDQVNNSSTTLYAKWSTAPYRVDFESGTATGIPSQYGARGGEIVPPPVPQRSGYAFGGWYQNSEATVPWDFNSGRLERSMTLYAKWKSLSSMPFMASASPAKGNITINGAQMTFDVYSIDNNNYFKLRDLAKALQYTTKRFNIGWNQDTNSITMETDQDYISVGGELVPNPNAKRQYGSMTQSTMYLDGRVVAMASYTIAGNNYIRLRDLAAAMDFNVSWNAHYKSIAISTYGSYKGE